MNKKTVIKTCVMVCSSVAFVLLFSSCGPPNERAHPAFKRGVTLMDKGEYKEAAESFEKYLTFNYNSSLTHYKLAELYNDYIDDPFLAVYHFRYYLKLEPDTSNSDAIKKWIGSAEKKLVERISENDSGIISPTEIQRLKEDNEKYRSYMIKLKDQNAEMRKKLQGKNLSSNGKKLHSEVGLHANNESGSHASFDISRTYKVQPGDNLSLISRKVYGSSKYYKLIFEANHDVLESEAELKINQELKIPKLKKTNDDIIIKKTEEVQFPPLIID